MRLSLSALTSQGLQNVVISGDESTTVGQLVLALRSNLRVPAQGLWAGGVPLRPDAPVAAALRDGDVVAFTATAATATRKGDQPAGVAEVRVSGGPSAGGVHRLPYGTATVGSGRWCTITVDDPSAPDCVADLRVEAGGVVVAPMAEGVTLDGERLYEPVPWPVGGVLKAGTTLLTLALPAPPDAHVSVMPEGNLAYNRPPRLNKPALVHTIEVPSHPARQDYHRLQLLASVIFGAGGVVMAVALSTPWFLLMALLTPLTMLAQWWSDRRYGRRQYRQAMKEYQARMAAFEQRLEELRRTDQRDRRAEFPDPGEVFLHAVGPRQRLWERRLHDPDTLHLRVGLADLPSKIELVPEPGVPSTVKEHPAVPVSHAVPLVVPLPRAGVVGLTGRPAASRSLARWLVTQAAALHSPRDLAIVVLSADPYGAAHWDWVRWLPHCVPREGEECVALVGNDPDSAARRVGELIGKINARRERHASPDAGQPFSFDPAASAGYASARPYNVLVVLDGARALRGLPGVPQILQLGPTVGVYAVCVDDDQRLLPEECTVVAVCEHERPGLVRLRGAAQHDVPPEAIGDLVSAEWCDRLARAIAPLRDLGREDADSVIPPAVRLLDLLGLPNPRPEQIHTLWGRGRTTRVPIGVGAEGLYSVDLRLDGPHGLIAGTTGAGKSELLQSLIASLAVHNRPDEMNFVLIDYKGGSAFKDCAKLPHTVGMVSDLDGHLTERALESLAAELKRREHLLLRADAKDIEDYNDYRDAGRPLEPMPRLLLVIDEFAAMVSELPDFILGLVDIARRGRSLGVHLILATQRPGGVVTPDIAANTNLRIALRVTSNEESMDVINSRNAAAISKTTPGRCFIRSGASSLHAVQSARIGGRRPGQGTATAREVRVDPVAWRDLGVALPAAADDDEDDATMLTDLSVLVEAVSAAAARLGLERTRSPWLPPLPELVTMSELPPGLPSEQPARGRALRLPFALADLPSQQRRRTEYYDLAGAGHLLVVGGGRTGRSTVLRAIAASAGLLCGPEDVHLYGVDCGNNALLPLAGMPHCGAVVGRDSPDRLGRLTKRLLEIIFERQQALAAQGFADVTEQRAAVGPQERLPYVLVLFDRWEGFHAAFESVDHGVLIDQWMQIFQEGPGAGVKVVLSGDRSTLIGRIATLFDDRLVLKLTDPTDYTYVGMKTRDVPEHMPPGRAFRSAADLREVQVVLLDPDPAGTAQVAALHQVARTAKSRHASLPPHRRPFRVDALPSGITLAETLALADPAPPPDAVVVGVGGDALGARFLRTAEDGPGLVVAGTPKSGRSTTLCTMLTYLLAHGWEAVLLTPRLSPLRDLAGRAGVRGCFGGDADAERVRQAASAPGRCAVLIDDLELLGNSGPLADWIVDHVGESRDSGNLVIGAGNVDDLDGMYTGPIVAMKRTRSGLLLRPNQAGQGDLFGVQLPRSLATGTGPPGRGLLFRGGAWERVQVAKP
ncbi:cell division protein FtsK [Nonomuraea phyllanthi]|uniref:FtsK/SpoIIIE domain-containing protein n=1 Tax=Nonomuraea phyllanthi TaxID=2219224 RepID=UPI0012939FAB|nr:FtsK/SpoIIIE domain-containing protein [Nonomuraea phyllanthi]QFY09455.1 cell division protein FtsK [Nonomuraea phyllanthi]